MNLFGKSLIHSDILSVIVVMILYVHQGEHNHITNVTGVIKTIKSVYKGAVNSVVTTVRV